jgi:hypothetical protein
MCSIASIASPFSSEFFQFSKKFQIDVLLDFHPSHESCSATQHRHTQTKLRRKLTDKASLVSPLSQVSLAECSQSRYLIATPHKCNLIPCFNGWIRGQDER